MAVAAQACSPPLCVDLDGTLLCGDTLLESVLSLAKRNPFYLVRAIFWLLRGRAVLKAEVAARVELNPAALSYNAELLDWLREEHGQGREIWLCTAADARPAETIAQYIGIFSGVFASTRGANLVGERKAQQLVGRFGRGAFDYCGNERRDLAIWRCARGAIVVNAGSALVRKVALQVPVLRSFAIRSHRAPALWRALRPHQWAKNILVLVPLVAAHRMRELPSLIHGLLGAFAFCLAASSVYVLNDMFDLEADRLHPRKSKRPFAAGELPLRAGLLLVPTLLGAAGLIATFLSARFALALGTYYLLTVGYSIKLKRILMIDAIALAGLYTLRLIAGAGAAAVPLSFWLLLFAMFLFLSLALVKRYAELDTLRRQQRLHAAGRGYHVEDLAVLENCGTAAGYLSVLVLALYINSPEIAALYRHPKVIWTLCVLLLYWVSRVWIKAHRGQMHDDPVIVCG